MPSLEAWVQVLVQDVRAWRRGEHRIAPRFDVNGRMVRGRIYARPDESSGGAMPAKARLKASMSFRVYRAATDTWEPPVEVPAKVEEKR